MRGLRERHRQSRCTCGSGVSERSRPRREWKAHLVVVGAGGIFCRRLCAAVEDGDQRSARAIGPFCECECGRCPELSCADDEHRVRRGGQDHLVRLRSGESARTSDEKESRGEGRGRSRHAIRPALYSGEKHEGAQQLYEGVL